MLQFWQHYLNPFLNSSFFLAFSTVLVAAAAYWLYKRQQKDNLRTAAYIIYLEIEKGEQLLKDAEETLTQYRVRKGSSTEIDADAMFPSKLQVMRTDSWNHYRPMLSRRLSVTNLNKIDEFYNNCRLLDEALTYIDAGFSRNESEVRVNAFRMVAQYMDDLLKSVKTNPSSNAATSRANQKIADLNKERLDAFKSSFPTSYSYIPIKPYQDAEYYASLLVGRSLINSPLGQALKQLAGVDNKN
jgi:hypothetical protein